MRTRDFWLAILAAVILGACFALGCEIGEYMSLTNEEAGYDQQAYDACMDSSDSEPIDCE